MRERSLPWIAVILALTSAPFRLVLADAVVGTGTASSCNEEALDAALNVGGKITFNCGPTSFIITLTSQKGITADASIDGAGLLILNGSGTTQPVVVNPGVTLTLANVTIRKCNGAIFNQGTLLVDNSAFESNRFIRLGGSVGGAILNRGTLTVTNTTFSRNSADEGGAIYGPYTALTVSNCTFSANSASIGGAIYQEGNTWTVNDSVFSNNNASKVGGAIYNSGNLTITRTSFSGNTNTDSAGGWGGAIYNDEGDMTVSNSTFSGNAASYVGGAIQNGYGRLTIDNSTFSDNAAPFGGAILDDLGLRISNTTFSGNRATHGGAILVDTPADYVFNSTFSGNSAADGAAIYFEGGGLSVINCTFSGNIGSTAIYNANLAALSNTIVAGISGENCSGTPFDWGHNLDSGATCGFSNSTGSQSNVDPLLDPHGLADNGGPTQTIALEAGSPAINAGDESTCLRVENNLDQRGFVRPGLGATNCSIGAYEFDSAGAFIPSPTPTKGVTPVPSPKTCTGDCSGDGHITVDEILTTVNIGLGNTQITACGVADANHDGQITVDEILAAVNNALNGCLAT